MQQLKENAQNVFQQVATKPDQYTALNLEEVSKLVDIDGKKQDISERKKFAKWIFWMLLGWLAIILGIIVSVGFSWIKLSDSVIIALITSTTLNVAGFFLAVTKYLFPSKAE